MGGFDDNGGIIGDWMPPNPSPRSFFAAMLGDEAGSRSGPEPPKYDNNNDNGFTFPGPNGDGGQRGQTVDHAMKTSEFSEQKTSSRGGLVERMAARAGHNAPRLNTGIMKPVEGSQNQQDRSPYLTIPPGLSPTSFLESPVFLSNSLVQPSPTTGKFQFAPNGNGNRNGNGNGNENDRSSMMFLDSSNKSKDSFYEEPNSASFAFKPYPNSASLPRDHITPPLTSSQSFQNNQTLIQSEKQFTPQKTEPDQNYSSLNNNLNRSQPHIEEHHDHDPDHRSNVDISNASSDDGYNWRKYGQKQVKGSDYPRSYYKCTQQNCPVKKKVERSHEGHITEIIYKGAHNHPKLVSNRRSGIGSSSMVSDTQGEMNEQSGSVWGTNLQQTSGSQWGQDGNFENMQGQFESSDAVDGSSTFSNDEEDDRVTHGSVSIGCDGEGDESESKRRRVEAYAADVSGATRAIREPRVVVQTTSEVDILDDGYRWRKYGQKVVKGNPNPRSYYKCTSTGCTVRKHVERASHDLKSVITTYEGKHNHDVPAARNTSHSNHHTMAPHQPPVHMARFTRPPYNNSPNGQQHHLTHHHPPNHGYGYTTMNQHGPPSGLAHMAMAMANQGVVPVHRYLGQQMVEPKVEPVLDPGLNRANGAPIYHQMMNRLPLGP